MAQQFSLRWNNYLHQMTDRFGSLRDEEELVDVTLSCEGKKLKAHKMLLSACSDYFQEVFRENPCPHPVIVFRNMPFVDLEAIVEFIYKGEVNVAEEQLNSFLQTAELLEVRGLGNCRTEPEGNQTKIPQVASQPLKTTAPETVNKTNISGQKSTKVPSTPPSKKRKTEKVKEEQSSIIETDETNAVDTNSTQEVEENKSSEVKPIHVAQETELMDSDEINEKIKGFFDYPRGESVQRDTSEVKPEKAAKQEINTLKPPLKEKNDNIPKTSTDTAEPRLDGKEQTEEVAENVWSEEVQASTNEVATTKEDEALVEEEVTEPEEVKEPEFDYYGCEICKTESKPVSDRMNFTHKCPICPCLCFCSHLLKEHMKVIHGWFNVQRRFTHF